MKLMFSNIIKGFLLRVLILRNQNDLVVNNEINQVSLMFIKMTTSTGLDINNLFRPASKQGLLMKVNDDLSEH